VGVVRREKLVEDLELETDLHDSAQVAFVLAVELEEHGQKVGRVNLPHLMEDELGGCDVTGRGG
jgi:hypothetical protein